ncbi:MAG: LysR family transcriptional regulator [Halieaceae bacterium]|jgi:DNA-binding transcriptional LysR family regulator|nr:LysR family transcriptional regulator [Halieaceae bacterium]
MNTTELSRIDLNLLISLDILLQEQSVSRAAKRLHITQPAMSKTLSRLRALFDDPLFTRSSHGMQPTPRALELAADLGGVLAGIRQLVTGDRFSPGSFVGEVTLALSEYIGLALLPELVRKLAQEAPRLSIRVITRIEDQLEQLALGSLDFAIHLEHAHYGPDYRVEKLGPSATTLLVREDHPLTRGELTPERLAGYPVIRPYISDAEQLEVQRSSLTYIQLLGSDRGSLEISHLLTALEVLRTTDYIMPGPAYILQNEGATRGLCALPSPPGGSPSIDYALVAHKRTAHSPLHGWLWEQITCTIRDLRIPLSRKPRQRVAAGSNDPLR